MGIEQACVCALEINLSTPASQHVVVVDVQLESELPEPKGVAPIELHQCCQKFRVPNRGKILSTAGVDSLKVAQFFVKQKCVQMSNFGRFYVAS